GLPSTRLAEAITPAGSPASKLKPPGRGPRSGRAGRHQPPSAERREHAFREEPRRLARVATEELHREERAAERGVMADALDHLVGRSPDAMLLETRAHVPAVDAAGALQRGARRVVSL